ncbi:peptide chain release factor 1 [Ruminococcaceae bacterium AM28-23LB]|nr:peptide chain release factor 1 [Ruminococcaceae bacterium AM28-23LB]
MLEKLELVEKRFGELEEALAQGDLYADPEKAARLLKEQKELTPVVEAYRAYRYTQKDMEDAQELMHSEEGEMRELAQAEFEESKDRLEELEQQIRLLLLPKDENDDKNVIVEIRGGVGGEEAALFAHSLFRMYSMYAERKRYTVEVLSSNETELGGIKEISFEVRGAGAFSRFKFESGTHRVQRVPETESSGRIHTSAATVAVLPEAEEVEVQIDPGDLQIDTYRSGGAGGQHVNKTESAIRITHIPTGLVVECQDERSQHKNRDRAMKILRTKLYEMQQQALDKERASERRSQVGSGDRSERVRTYNYPQGRVTDHRIGLTLHRLDAVLDGDLDEIIDALIAADQAEKLRAGTEE